MRKERTFPPAQPCSGSPARAHCGCGAALDVGWMHLHALSALRRCSPWLPLQPGGIAAPLGFLGSPTAMILLLFLEPGTAPHSPLGCAHTSVALQRGGSAKDAPARSYQLPTGDWPVCI